MLMHQLTTIDSLRLWVHSFEPTGVTYGQFFAELKDRCSGVLEGTPSESMFEVQARLMAILALCRAKGLLGYPSQNDELICASHLGMLH